MEASLFEIIVFGIMLNWALLFFAVILTTVALIKATLGGNFEIAIWSEKAKARSKDIKERRSYSTLLKYEEFIIIMMPFTGLIRTPAFLYGVIKYGFPAYIDKVHAREIARLESKGK